MSDVFFAHLYRRTSVATRLRVTEAYHKMLRRVWEEFNPGEPFMVSAAEREHRAVAEPWKRILDSISEPANKKLLRELADLGIPRAQSPARLIRFVEFNADEQGSFCNSAKVAHLMQKWVSACEVNCRVIQHANGFAVMGHTDEIGVAMLYRKSGPTVSWMLERIDTPTFYRMFPWVTRTDTSVRVNPLRRPVYTPDVMTEIDEIICKPQ